MNTDDIIAGIMVGIIMLTIFSIAISSWTLEKIEREASEEEPLFPDSTEPDEEISHIREVFSTNISSEERTL